MIKIFVEKTLDDSICRLNPGKLRNASLSHDLKITDNLVCSTLHWETTSSISKLKRTRTNLLVNSKFLETQIHIKGFDQGRIKYLLEPDDSYLNNVVHKPYE
jgi:hypothetical protein